jgi:multicomponent K+:H+ antiporter subunit G
MTAAADLPPWAALLTAALLLLGSATTLIGALGLLRLKTFYERVHAPTLGTTLGTGCIILASMIYFLVIETRLVLHEILIAVFVTVTTPVTLMILVRAAVLRDRWESAQKQGGMDIPLSPARVRTSGQISEPPKPV